MIFLLIDNLANTIVLARMCKRLHMDRVDLLSVINLYFLSFDGLAELFQSLNTYLMKVLHLSFA